VLIDHTNQRVLEVLETREKRRLKAWLEKSRASGLLAELEEVTTDMWDGFTMAARGELAGSRWLWVTNTENLSPEQQQELKRLKRRFPDLARLSEHREELRRVFEDRDIRTAAVGTLRLREWCRQGRRLGLAALEPFYTMLENWMDKIANYFVSRSSNGRTEGFNRNLRCLLWRACGMRNFNHFRLRVLHALG
jgi:transposase